MIKNSDGRRGGYTILAILLAFALLAIIGNSIGSGLLVAISIAAIFGVLAFSIGTAWLRRRNNSSS